MCGIVGFTGSKQTKILDIMLDSITHRGPDGEGRLEAENFSIGMRRLSIIDPKSGWQPIWNEDQTVAIILNGEIYNYQSLWKDLETKGHKFRSNHSDTETVLHGYEEWGYEVVQKLRGMFAFCIYDQKKDQLFVARDRLGIKPLYYTKVDSKLFFASEIKALLKATDKQYTTNKSALHNYLYYRTHDHLEETFFKDIFRLPAGHYMIIDSGGNISSKTRYWNPEINLEFSGTKTDGQYADELREQFVDSVESHLISDVPVGVTLSGGLDSTGVVSVMSKLFSEKHTDLHTSNLLTFSAVYPGDSIDESNYIDIAAEYTHAEQHKITPTADLFWDEINDWIYTQEEPTISSAPYAIYSVMREASKYVKVMLSGQGGDELFAGYIPYFASYISSARASHKYLEIAREMISGFDLYINYFKQKLRSKKSNSNEISMTGFINQDYFINERFIHKLDPNLNSRLFQDITKYSVPNVLRYEDKNAMAFSIETRVPFLDHKFVEYVFSLPIDQKIKHGWNRYVYRNAMKGLIPEEIRLRRKKIGFTTPENRWLRSKSINILAIFESPEFASRGIFNAQKIISDYKAWLDNTKFGDGLIFWRILNTELWMRKFNISI
jgi:asparagine synthase (glutamine-hydrolysing)